MMRHTGKVQAALAFGVVIGFFGVLWLLMTLESGGFMKDSLLILVGALVPAARAQCAGTAGAP